MGVSSEWGSGVPLQQCQACGNEPQDGGERCPVCGASTPEALTYTLTLTITRAVRGECYDDIPHDVAVWMKTREAKRQLEKDVLQALKKLDGDCDVEVMDCEETR